MLGGSGRRGSASRRDAWSWRRRTMSEPSVRYFAFDSLAASRPPRKLLARKPRSDAPSGCAGSA